MDVRGADRPLQSVAVGAGRCLRDLKSLGVVLISSKSSRRDPWAAR